jgi:hypothetical protein
VIILNNHFLQVCIHWIKKGEEEVERQYRTYQKTLPNGDPVMFKKFWRLKCAVEREYYEWNPRAPPGILDWIAFPNGD